jgi:hypothetical protein
MQTHKATVVDFVTAMHLYTTQNAIVSIASNWNCFHRLLNSNVLIYAQNGVESQYTSE